MNFFRAFVILLFCLLPTAVFVQVTYAVTPPAPVTPTLAKLLFTMAMPATRTDGTPLAVNEIAKTRIYVSSFDSVVEIPGAAANYTYTLAPGVCVAATDSAAATVVDSGGRESAASIAVTTPALCGPKPLPAAPTNLKVTAG